jgi:hypothetical protein
MFTQTWREHWGLQADPFACEDADKDRLLSRIDLGAVHSGFDRVFGDPRVPGPGIVFGEKGSGKSGLRLMMKRRLEAHNAEHPDARVFVVESIDLNPFLDELHKVVGKKTSGAKATARVVGQWEIADHLDAMLSLAVTQLADDVLSGAVKPATLTPKQKLDMLLLVALYDRSPQRTSLEAVERLRGVLGGAIPGQGTGGQAARVLLTLLGAFIAIAPSLTETFPALADWPILGGEASTAINVGIATAVLPWVWWFARKQLAAARARKIERSVRVLPDDASAMTRLLYGLSGRVRGEFALPEGSDEGSRYDLLQRFLGLLEGYGFEGMYVLLDRVDEPTLLSESPEAMRAFVAKMLDIKLLQHPRLALKLFLPIELEGLWHGASADELRRMRLDKSNLIAELKWTGRELYEVANQRLCAVAEGGRASSLIDLCGEDLPLDHLLETLESLGTPRYAFSFLAEVFNQHVKDLPDGLSADDPRWRLERARFDVVRAGWIDRAGFLRRTLN